MMRINFGLCLVIACIALSMAAPRSKKHSRMLEIPLEGENPFNAMIVENGGHPREFPVEPEKPKEPEEQSSSIQTPRFSEGNNLPAAGQISREAQVEHAGRVAAALGMVPGVYEENDDVVNAYFGEMWNC